MIFGYKTFAAPGWEERSDSIAGKVSRIDSFKFIYMGVCRELCIFWSDAISISPERKNSTSDCICKYKNFRKCVKNINPITSHVVMVKGGHIERESIRIKFLEYIYYNTY